MPVPVDAATPELGAYLTTLEERLSTLETAAAPRLAYTVASTALTVASAALYASCWVIVSDLKTMAYSTGSHWLRVDTGANIV